MGLQELHGALGKMAVRVTGRGQASMAQQPSHGRLATDQPATRPGRGARPGAEPQVSWCFLVVFLLSKKMVVSWALGTGATAAPLETPRSSACSSHPTTLTSPQAYRLGRQEE